jgi:hypothetical protein
MQGEGKFDLKHSLHKPRIWPYLALGSALFCGQVAYLAYTLKPDSKTVSYTALTTFVLGTKALEGATCAAILTHKDLLDTNIRKESQNKNINVLVHISESKQTVSISRSTKSSDDRTLIESFLRESLEFPKRLLSRCISYLDQLKNETDPLMIKEAETFFQLLSDRSTKDFANADELLTKFINENAEKHNSQHLIQVHDAFSDSVKIEHGNKGRLKIKLVIAFALSLLVTINLYFAIKGSAQKP